jgi:PAS domain S-box-containing protein
LQHVNPDLLNGWDVTPLNAAPIAVLAVDAARRIRYTNSRLDEIFGYDQNQLHNELLEVLIPPRIQAIHAQYFYGYIDDPRFQESGVELEIIGQHKDGQELPLEVGLSYFHHGDELFMLVTTSDLSAHKHAAQALQQSEERYRRLTDLSPYAVFVNYQNRVTYANPSCARLFGAIQPDELIGRDLFDLFPPDAHPLIQERIQHTLETLTPLPPVEEKIIRLDGTVIKVKVVIVAYQDGADVAIQVVLTDITDRKYIARTLEQQVEERTHEIEQRRQVSAELGHILALLNSNQSVTTVLNYIVMQTMNYLHASTCSIFFLEENLSQLVVPISCGYLAHELMQSSFPLNEEIASGLVTLSQQVLVISDLNSPIQRDEPELISRRQWLQKHGYQALLALPLFIKSEINGSLILYYQNPHSFTEQEIELARAFTHQAALAIENRRLRTQIEQAAVAIERGRIARDLHDSVTQTLFSASLITEVLPVIWQEDQAAGQQRLAELRDLTRGALAEMRTLLLELLPARLIEIDLADLLRQLAEASRTRVPVTIQVEGSAEIPDDVKMAIYRITQEALNNIAKHAHAHQVVLRLAQTMDFIALIIEDDGRGFQMENVKAQSLGLNIMRERAEAINASLEIQSHPNSGTVVTLRWLAPK